MTTPAVTVVIPTFNSERWLPGCLASLDSQTARPAAILVVDNGSRDGTVQALADRPVRVIALGHNTGFAHAANVGMRQAQTELVALINPDVELADDWLERMAAPLGDPAVAAVASKMVSLANPREIYDAGDIVRRDGACLQRGRLHRDDGSYDTPGEIFGACAGAALYRRAAVQAVGGFDERYVTYLEDADLAIALRVAGWRCAYVPAVARHAGEGASPYEGAHLDWVARNTLLLVAKWFPMAWWPQVAYRQAALLAQAARHRRLVPQLRALGRGAVLGARARRRRPRPAVPIATLIPVLPIRGPEAEGHPDRIAASWATDATAP